MMFPYSLPLAAVSVLAIIASALTTYRHRERRVIAGAILVTGAAIWLMMQALEFTSNALQTKFFFFTMWYVGIVIVPGAWLVLAMLICGYDRQVCKRNILVLSVVPILTLLLVLTNGYHGLMFTNVSLNPTDPTLPLVITFAPAYYVVVVLYSYTLMAAGFFMVVRRTIATRSSLRGVGVQTIVAVMVPWVLDAAYVLDPNAFMNLEPSSLAISVAGAVLLWRIVKLPILGVLPVAHETLIDSMNEAIFVLDQENHIVDANPKAQNLLGTTLRQTLGESIEKTWTEWPTVERALDSGTEMGREVTFGVESDRRFYELQGSAIEGLIGNASYRLVTLRDITERKQMENALQESDRHLRLITNHMFDWVIQTDLQGTFEYVSPSHRALGYEPKDLLGKSIFELIHPEDLERSVNAFQEAIQTRSPKKVELRYRHADGHYVWIESVGNPTFDEKNEVTGGIIASRDITERKQVEEVSSHLAAIVEFSDDAIIGKTLDGVITSWNQGAVKLYGYAADDVEGKSISILVPPGHIDELKQILERVRKGQPFEHYETQRIRKDGTIIDVSLTVSPVKDSAGRIVGASTIARDITERKRAEEKLQRSEEKYRTLVENINDIVFSVDSAGHVAYISPAVERIAGYKTDELIGQPFSHFVLPEDLDTLRSRFERVLAGEVQPLEYRLLTKNGDVRYVRSSSRPLTDTGRVVGITGVIIDITERRKMQAELQKYTKHLEQLVEARTADLAASERKYHLISDNMADAVFTIDLQGNLTFASPQNEETTGYPVQKLLSMNIKQLIAPEDLPSIMNRLEARIRGEIGVPPIQFDLIRSDGTRRPIEIHTKLLTDEGGKPVGVQGVGRDVSERKRMENALRSSEARFRELANMLPQIVYETDLSGNYTFANHSGLAAGGYTEQDILNGLNAFQTFAEQDRGRAMENILRILSGQDLGPQEYTALRKDGSTFPVLVHSTAIIREGKVVGVRGVAMDITEQKRMEENLRNSEARFREMANLLPQIIFEIDERGNYTFVNRSGLAAAGYTEEEALSGLNAVQTFIEEDREKIKRSIERILAGEDVGSNEYTALRKDGTTFPVLIHSTAIIRQSKTVGVRGVAMDITERKRMEEELAMSERKYRLLVDNMADVVFTIDLEGNYTFCTPEAEKMTGYTTQQLLSMNMSELIAPEHLPRVLKSLELRMRVQTELPPIRFDIVRANGTRLPIEVKTSLQLDGNNLVGVHGVARDITERKQIEDALRESEARFRGLAELLPQPVLELDNEGKFTFANRAAFTLSGYTEEDLRRGINALDLVAPEDQERLAQTMMRIVSGEEAAGDEYTIVRKDGRTFPVFMQAVRVMRGTEFLGFRAIAVDITERKAAEEELQKLASVVRYSSELVNLATLDGKMIFLNEAGSKMLGINSEEVQRINIMQVIPDHLQKKVENEVLPALMSGRNWEGDLQYRNLKTGRLTDVHATTFTIRDPTTRKSLYLANVSLDITERKRLEAQLAESERLAAIGSTAAMVGHDLRNPLQAMTGTLYLAKERVMSEKVEDRKEALGLLARLDDAIRYMDKIVSDLQDYARPVGADLVETSLPDLIKDTVLNVRVPANVEVTVSIQSGLSNVKLDPLLFKRVLTNLILNALQAMPKGGKLKIVGSTGDGSLTVAVRDTGLGITPENLAKIFNPFFTTKAQGQGLGLAVCKRLAEAQGGTLEVTSQVGEGSTFTLKIPTNRTTAAS